MWEDEPLSTSQSTDSSDRHSGASVRVGANPSPLMDDRMIENGSLNLLGAAAPLLQRRVYNNFTRMSLFFALNHGCVTSVLALSTVLLGKKGSYQSGALYVTYALTALLAASPITSHLGSRIALIIGSFTYCIYVVSLPLALLAKDPDSESTIAILGGGIGGIAAGFLWSAQGSYFAASAQLYAQTGGDAITPEEATAAFAARFGWIYLGLELVLKVVPLALGIIEAAIDARPAAPNGTDASPPPPLPPAIPAEHAQLETSKLVVGVTYSILALASALAMCTILDLDAVERAASGQRKSDGDAHATTAATAERADGACEPSATAATASSAVDGGGGDDATQPAAPPARQRFSFDKLIAAVLLWRTRPTVLLLAPFQMAFGLCSSLLGFEIAYKVVRVAFPDGTSIVDSQTAASLLSALVALIAASLQLPLKALASRVGKAPIMLGALLAFGGFALLVLLLDEGALAAHVPLVACYVLQGLGRACYEGINKSLYADFFPRDSEAAFANIVIANGGAAAAAFFIFPEIPRATMAAATLTTVCIAVVCYIAAETAHRRGSVLRYIW